MKNITKKLIAVFSLVTIFSFGANFAFAAGPILSNTGPSSPANTVTLGGAYSNTTGGATTTWFDIATSNSNLVSGNSQVACQNVQSSSGQMISCDISVGDTYGSGSSAITIAAGTTYVYRVSATNAAGTISHSGASNFKMGGSSNNGGGGSSVFTLSNTGPSSPANTVTLGGAYSNTTGGATTTWFDIATSNSNLVSGNSQVACQNVQSSSGQMISCDISVGDTYGSGSSAITIAAGTTYVYRVSATNAAGTEINSSASSFTMSGGNGGSCSASPHINIISPISVTVGSGSMTLSVNGTGFSNGTISYNGSDRNTTSNSTSASATLSSSDTNSVGNKTIVITNANGCASNSMTFRVNSNGSSGGGGGSGGGSSSYSYPTVSTISSTVNGTNVTLNGNVNAHGNTTTAWFNYGTSTNSLNNETAHMAVGELTYSTDFSNTLTLNPSTTYYFQAVANNAYGTTTSSTILSFTTTGETVLTTNSNITTVIATNKTTTTARLNAIATLADSMTNYGYFQYGSTPSMNNTTTSNNLGNTAGTVSFYDTVTNLTPGTIYYFRAVEKNANGTFTGNTFVFQTLNTTVASTTTPAPAPVVEAPTVTTLQSDILTITTMTDKVAVGDAVEYLITYKNNNAVNIENTKLTIQLPKEIVFDSVNFGTIDANNTITFNPDILVASQVGSITIKGHVGNKATAQSVLLTTATMTYNLTGSADEKDEIAYVANHVTEGNNLTAASIFGSGTFLPKTLIGWMVLVLVVLGLIVAGRQIYVNYFFKRKVNIDSVNPQE